MGPIEVQKLTQKNFPKTWEVLQAGVTSGVAPGFVAGVWRKSQPEQMEIGAIGNRRILPSVLPMEMDTVFDLASVTKVFATAPLAAVLIERGWLNWDTPLSQILPSYPYSEIQIRHLLSHTAGFEAWQPFWEKLKKHFSPAPIWEVSLEARQKKMREMIFSVTPDAKPGEKCVYSDISFLLLGYALEEVSGMSLDQAVRRFVWNPMGINNTYYSPVFGKKAREQDERVAATEDCPWRGGVIQGKVHDDNCWAMGGVGGHAGAFGRAQDLLIFAAHLFHGFFSKETQKAFWKKVEKPIGCSRTLGWDTPSGEVSSAGRFFSSYSVGHLGFTGTSLWIDPVAEIAVVLLSNRVHPSRENIKIRDFRPQFHDAIRLDLEG
jgi:CubicO group peptidase (beta-lactamase class C family)